VSETLGIDELIEHGVTGFIVPHKDYSKIPLMILGLSEQEKQQIRHKAREFIINNFDVEVSMKKYLEVWQTKGVKYEHLDI
jgi:glycosyltransferase involved in cell wall biosynthesis